MKNTLVKYLVATLGLFLVAVGIALSIISNLGTSPLSCPAYVLNLRIPGISVGTFTWLVNLLYVFVQLAVLRKRFRAKYLMQIVASIVFGALIDASLWMFSWLHPTGFAQRFGVAVVSCLVSALGVSIEVVARGWMLSAEMTVYSFVKAYGFEFGKTKVVMDSLVVVISAALSLIFFRNPLGNGEFTSFWDAVLASSGESVIGIGTLLSAVSVGWLMKFTDPLADWFMNRFVIPDPEKGGMEY